MTNTALVTGSTSNIGKAIAERLAREGHHVVVTSRHGDEADEVAGSLPQSGTGFEVDFSIPADIEDLFTFIAEEFGGLDVLVNSLAMSPKQSVLDCEVETWDQAMNTNLRSYFLCTREAGRLMVEDGGGNIINITISRDTGSSGRVAYSVSKYAIKMLTMCSALDLAPHDVRVNSIGSGIVGTPVGQRDMTGRSHESDRIPLGHIGEAEDIAGAVGYLISDDAKYVTGAEIDVDGGKEIN